MDWVKATEEELLVIKKQLLGSHVAFLIILLFFLPSLAVCEVMAVITMINKASIPFTIFSIIIQALIILSVVGLIYIIAGEIKGFIEINSNRIEVCHARVYDKKIVPFGRNAKKVIKVELYNGKKYSIRGEGNAYNKAEKGMHALVVRYPHKKLKGKDTDYEIAVITD